MHGGRHVSLHGDDLNSFDIHLTHPACLPAPHACFCCSYCPPPRLLLPDPPCVPACTSCLLLQLLPPHRLLLPDPPCVPACTSRLLLLPA